MMQNGCLGKRMMSILLVACYASLVLVSAASAPARQTPEAIEKAFAAKCEFIKPLIVSLDSMRKSSDATLLKKNRYEESYKLSKDGGEYTYVFNSSYVPRGTPFALYSIQFRDAAGVGFVAEFSAKGMIRFTESGQSGVPIGTFMAWWPDTLKPWYFYQLTIREKGLSAFQEVRWDREGKVSCDAYSEAGDIAFRGEGSEYSDILRARHPKQDQKPSAPQESEAVRLTKEASEYVPGRPREEVVAKYQAAMNAAPGDPDNFFCEFNIGCKYAYVFNEGEKRDTEKAEKIFRHCIEAYPEHATNLYMLQTRIYVGEYLLAKKDLAGAAEQCWKVIETPFDSIVVFIPRIDGIDMRTELTEDEKKDGLTKESPEYKKRIEKRPERINSVRSAACDLLTSVEKEKGGISALTALLEKRKDDATYQTAVRQAIDHAQKQIQKQREQEQHILQSNNPNPSPY